MPAWTTSGSCRQAEAEADVIVWDGGNNDLPFFVSGFHIVVADPHRPGHETTYHPGEANARCADVFVVNEVDTAAPENVLRVHENLRAQPTCGDHRGRVPGPGRWPAGPAW
jgi:predicted GTPase